MSIAENIINQATRALARKLDDELEAALNCKWGKGQWTKEMVTQRCVWKAKPGRIQVLVVEGERLLEVHPIECMMNRHSLYAVVEYTQKIRRMYK